MDLQDLSVGLLQVPNKQWGFEETETKTIAFPISFESIKYVFLSKIYGPASGGADTVAYNFFRKSLTGVSFDYAYTRNWLAIGGKQPQWGKILGDTVNLKVIDFPVPFNECFGGVTLFNGDPVAAAEYATITDITNANFKIYMYANNAGTGYANANIFYLFLGT